MFQIPSLVDTMCAPSSSYAALKIGMTFVRLVQNISVDAMALAWR